MYISTVFFRKTSMRVKFSIAVLLSVKSHCFFVAKISSQLKSRYLQSLLVILIGWDLHYVVFSYLIGIQPLFVRVWVQKKLKRSDSAVFSGPARHSRLVGNGLLNINNELVTLNQRAFIWVMFIPRTTHAHFWSQSTEAKFWLESSVPDLFAESFGINLVYRHNMEELIRHLQCSAPFDSFLDSCDPRVFCNVWDNHPEFFIGTKNSYEYLHPQRLFISQEETSVTAQYSYEEDSYPHNCFRVRILNYLCKFN